MKKKQSIYLDTSVINFLFADDAPERKEITKDFFDNFIKTGIYECYISGFVIDEIENTTNATKKEKLLKIIEDYPIDIRASLKTPNSRLAKFVKPEFTSRKGGLYKFCITQKLDFFEMPFIEINNADKIEELAKIYVDKGIIPYKKYYDAYHIACSVTNKIDYLISWNFRHLANVNRERKVMAANLEIGYIHEFRIITPLELMDYEN